MPFNNFENYDIELNKYFKKYMFRVAASAGGERTTARGGGARLQPTGSGPGHAGLPEERPGERQPAAVR